MKGTFRMRAVAALAALLTVAAGLGVRAVAGGAVTKYAGDALYTILLFTLVLSAAPRTRPATAGAVALTLSWAVEFAQLTGVPAELSARSTLARLVLGSSFNPPDLFWYAVGALVAWSIHQALRSRTERDGFLSPRGRDELDGEQANPVS